MYINSEYIPVINNRVGKGISTAYGVTQGGKSSTNLYSFFVADMPDELNELILWIHLTLACSQTTLHYMLIPSTH